MEFAGDLQCDLSSGQYAYGFTLTDNAGLGLDTVKTMSLTPGVTVPGMVSLSGGLGSIGLTGAAPGQPVQINICAFNQAAKDTGQPFDCCRQTVTFVRPQQSCPIQ